tara:strand:- start:1509 stop:1892 length:384 start_codon:yes stop_codon:yes gene_type:complete
MFPERMGHCICYKGPAYFTTFFNLVKPLIDPKTVSKIRFINGDVSDGSNNDTLLRDIIGDNWKEITGATSQVIKKGASPGYDHCAYWPRLMERIRLIQDEEIKKDLKILADDVESVAVKFPLPGLKP